MELQDAIDTLADGNQLRIMTRHNAADFVQAIAKVVEAARRVANGKRQWFCDDQKDLWDDPGCEFIYPESNHDKCGWVLVFDITEDTEPV